MPIKLKKMTESVLISSLNTMSSDASNYCRGLSTKDNSLWDRYSGELYRDEEEDRSKVTSNDVEDVIESDMVSVARVFLGAGEIIEFTAKNPEDQGEVEEAKIKTKYADWLIRKQSDSYAIQSSILKDILVQKSGGVAKYMIEDVERPETKEWTAINELELQGYLDSLEGEDVKSIDIVERSGEFDDENSIDFKIKVIHKEQRINIVAVPSGCFVISRNAKSKDDAQIIGDDTTITRGELVAMGYTKEQVDKAPMIGDDGSQSANQLIDNKKDGEDLSYSPTWASEEILLKTRYPKIDFDGDGIDERRYVLYSGNEIFENEPFDHVPYALGSAITIPHKAIGRSRAEQAAPFAEQNTTILRGMFDNQYAVLTPRVAYNDLVDEDDLFDMEHGGGVKIEGDGHPGNALMPIEIPYIGDKALQFMQFQGQRRAQTTGTLLASQGLEADDFSEETAARFNGVRDEGKGRIELVARNMIDTMLKGMDINNTSKFFNDPERPDQVLQFQNEQLTAQLQQAVQAIEQLSQKNPLAEAEMIKAEAKARETELKSQIKLMEDSAKVQLQAANLAEDQRQFDAKLAAEVESERNNLTVKLTELELQHQTDLGDKEKLGIEFDARIGQMPTSELIGLLNA